MSTTAPRPGQRSERARLRPLYAAGFTTAFGAHSVAANLGRFTTGHHQSLLVLGGLLALYDGAEVLLKPVAPWPTRSAPARYCSADCSHSPRPRPCSPSPTTPHCCGAARLGQGAAASAFSPAASALVARLNPVAKHGRAFGSYGFYKSIGYTAGPLLGGALVAGWRTAAAVHRHDRAGRSRRRLGGRCRPRCTTPAQGPTNGRRPRRTARAGQFPAPTAALALATAALSAGVGFLPVTGAAAHLGPVATGAAVSLLAACAALVQPRAGAALDHGRITTATGISAGLAVTAAGLAAAMLPGLTGLLLALIGAGTGMITPLGFAALATASPAERLGQTMGAAELGRELGGRRRPPPRRRRGRGDHPHGRLRRPRSPDRCSSPRQRRRRRTRCSPAPAVGLLVLPVGDPFLITAYAVPPPRSGPRRRPGVATPRSVRRPSGG